jgi:putative transposase
MGRPRATHYRHHRTPPLHGPPAPRPRSPRALTHDQVDEIVEVLNSERFCDQAPAQVWATLLDEGRYLASISTMYRILRDRHQVRERRQQARHPAHLKPELVATGPNQVWSWDITKLAGPHKWNWFHLYVIIDVWSRFVVGWLVAPRESDTLAHELIAACADIESIQPDQLTLAR